MNWTFEEALKCMKAGGNARRDHWPVGSKVSIQQRKSGVATFKKFSPLGNGGREYIYQATAADLLATNWMAAP